MENKQILNINEKVFLKNPLTSFWLPQYEGGAGKPFYTLADYHPNECLHKNRSFDSLLLYNLEHIVVC